MWVTSEHLDVRPSSVLHAERRDLTRPSRSTSSHRPAGLATSSSRSAEDPGEGRRCIRRQAGVRREVVTTQPPPGRPASLEPACARSRVSGTASAAWTAGLAMGRLSDELRFRAGQASTSDCTGMPHLCRAGHPDGWRAQPVAVDRPSARRRPSRRCRSERNRLADEPAGTRRSRAVPLEHEDVVDRYPVKGGAHAGRGRVELQASERRSRLRTRRWSRDQQGQSGDQQPFGEGFPARTAGPSWRMPPR